MESTTSPNQQQPQVLEDDENNQDKKLEKSQSAGNLRGVLRSFLGSDSTALGASALVATSVAMKVFSQDYDERMYRKYGLWHRTLASTYYRMSQVLKLRAISDFVQGSRKVGQGTVWLLGVCYPEKEVNEVNEVENGKKVKKNCVYLPSEVVAALQSDFESRIWITYRRDFKPIGEKGFTTDVGWGCTLRSGQMMLAQALQIHYFGRSWRRGLQQRECVQVLNWFRDEPDCPFSIHKFVQMGSKHGVIAGQWLGPYVVSRTLETMVNEQIGEHVYCHVLFDSGGGAPTLDGQRLSQFFMEAPKLAKSSLPSLPVRQKSGSKPQQYRGKSTKGLILLVPLVLGVNKMNEQYHRQILTLFTYPQSIGVLGGKPSSSLYFIGFQHNSVLYLDPHESQAVVRDDDMSSYHCGIVRHLPVSSMDSSLALGFYCADKADLEDLCARLLELEMSSKGAPLITQSAAAQFQNQNSDILERFPDDQQISFAVGVGEEEDWEVVL
eukprot:TRINITY_DN14245_c0_g1_i3.p1 TRINITY_DN14245_c0_g1~~TRINITY_DN14245_c0_g1_i3.p1  ORF type:complete len:495 (+),score=60.50 TRINITY_DN14245_c0_g1_i3:147-1631(+)